MMSKSQTEEQYPLLLFLVGERETSKNNKRHSNKGRFDRITTGAAQVITEWPNNIGSSWATALLCILAIFMLSLMIVTCINFHMNSHRMPRCVNDYPVDNQTIHLVHSSHRWSQRQLQLINNITSSFPDFKINLIIIKERSILLNTITKKHGTRPMTFNHTRIAKRQAEQNNKITVDYLKSIMPNSEISVQCYKRIFAETPLRYNWPHLSHEMKMFAVRLLQIWQYGGIAFDLDGLKKSYFYKGRENDTVLIRRQSGMDDLLEHGYERFSNLMLEAVSADNSGLHMATKSPCHAFFGNVLMKMARAGGNWTPQIALRDSLYSFCEQQVVEDIYCIFT